MCSGIQVSIRLFERVISNVKRKYSFKALDQRRMNETLYAETDGNN